MPAGKTLIVRQGGAGLFLLVCQMDRACAQTGGEVAGPAPLAGSVSESLEKLLALGWPDLMRSVFAAPAQWLVAGVAVVALLAALLFGMALIGARKRARRQRLQHEKRIADLEKELVEAAYFTNAVPSIHIVWGGQGKTAPRVRGTLDGVAGIPEAPGDVLDFKAWLDAESARILEEALVELKSWGTAFNLFLRVDGEGYIEADGHAHADMVSLRLRDVTGKRLELAQIRETCTMLERDARSFQAMLDAAPVSAWLRGHDGSLIWVNRTYAEAVGASSADKVIGGGLELVSDDEREAADHALASHGKCRQQAYAVIDGERRALDVVVTSAACGSAGLAIDMTDTDSLHRELQRHDQAHEKTLDQLESAVAIFDASQSLKYFNAAYVALWGLDEEWLRTGPTDGEVFDRLRMMEQLPVQGDYHSWKAENLRIYNSVETREDWWYLPGGQTLRVVSQPHPLGGATWLFEDVSEKLELKSRFQAAVTEQSETLDNLREGVAMFGSNGRLKLFNPAFANMWKLDKVKLGATPHIDVMIKWCRPLLDDDDIWADIKADLTSVGEERRPSSWRMQRQDGLVLDAFFVPLPQRASLLAFVDETNSARIEQALRERNEALVASDRQKTAFVNHVSYQLREPLTSIMGFAELLKEETFGPLNEKQHEYLTDINSASKVLDTYINDILDLATINAGGMGLELSEVNVGDVMEASARLVKDRLEGSGLQLEVDIDESTGTIIADRARLMQILYKLLSNAIDFSTPGGVIEMAGRRDGDMVTIRVTDQGCGIHPGLQDKIFDSFESQSENGTHRGAGLGLAIVKGFVTLHGGEALCDSKEGEGTTITCRFPVEGPARTEDAAD